jgi:butyryl-CoA dehydrogenase
MAKKYTDMDTLKFILHGVHPIQDVLDRPHFSDHDQESIEMFIQSVKDFSDQELFPYFQEMDADPARFEDGKVVVHPQVGKYMRKAGEMGLISGVFDYDDGGLQIPSMAHTAAAYIMDAANNHMPGYGGLTLGAAELILHFASQELKEKYTPKMLSGEWGGTMCLTEPQAGSSLSDITTSATPADDGSYRIKGQKIFISGGDHEYCDNFVHLVLARIDGAPAGTKGISLFIVPKNRIVNGDDLESNDVTTAGDFQKMGQKGYCTTHLIFGEKDDCQGWLVGKPNNGLKYMFMMMNGARIAVGRGAAAIVSAAYHASLEYAQERPQGRRLTSTGKKDVQQEQTLIINHPDVRRMLLLQKAVSEGSLSLTLLAAKYHDLSRTAETEAERHRYLMMLELLTPVVKTYPSEMGATAVSNGLQVLGGYGFCSEYILQQYHRDIRIFAIYEGTTGIQSLDLLGRKMTMDGGKAVEFLSKEILTTITEASQYDELKDYAAKLGEKLKLTQEVMAFLLQFAKKGDFQRFTSDANLFMEFFSNIVLAWLWLDMATHAKKALLTGDKNFSEAFYESKIHTMRYFFKYELVKTISLAEALMDENVVTIPSDSEVFA